MRRKDQISGGRGGGFVRSLRVGWGQRKRRPSPSPGYKGSGGGSGEHRPGTASGRRGAFHQHSFPSSQAITDLLHLFPVRFGQAHELPPQAVHLCPLIAHEKEARVLVRHGSPQSASAARDEVVEGVPSWWLLSGLAPARKCPASQRLVGVPLSRRRVACV